MQVHLTFVLLLVSSVSAFGQDVLSGPERGKNVPALKVFDATGMQSGKEVDYASERKGQPTVYLLVNADRWERPMARFIKGLDEVVRQDDASYVVAVWVGGDVEKMKEYLPIAQQSLQMKATALCVFAANKEGPEGWGLNSDAHLTAVVAFEGKVAAVFAYRSLNETDVPAVSDALKKAKAAK